MKRRQLLQSTLAFGTLSSVALPAPAVVADKPKADMSTDVVIVGGGFAGLTAAVMASRAGAKVVVLEKRSYCGGDGVLSAGIIASAYSEVHKAQGFKGKADLDSYWQLIEEGHTDEPLSKVRDNMPNSPMYSGIAKHDPNVLRRSAEMSPAVAAFVMSYGIDFCRSIRSSLFCYRPSRDPCRNLRRPCSMNFKSAVSPSCSIAQ